MHMYPHWLSRQRLRIFTQYQEFSLRQEAEAPSYRFRDSENSDNVRIPSTPHIYIFYDYYTFSSLRIFAGERRMRKSTQVGSDVFHNIRRNDPAEQWPPRNVCTDNHKAIGCVGQVTRVPTVYVITFFPDKRCCAVSSLPALAGSNYGHDQLIGSDTETYHFRFDTTTN